MYILALRVRFRPRSSVLARDLSREKAQHEEKSANFGTKIPVKRRKTGSFSAKVVHLCTPLGFPPSKLPFHGLTRSAFSAPFARLPDLSAPPPDGVGGVWATPHAATRNALAAHTGKKDVRLELHAPMPENTPFTDANSGRTQRMIEKQTRKFHKIKTRARVRRFKPRERPRKTSTAFLRNAEGRERNN